MIIEALEAGKAEWKPLPPPANDEGSGRHLREAQSAGANTFRSRVYALIAVKRTQMLASKRRLVVRNADG